MNRIAIIGTAGRDKSKPMTKNLWRWMYDTAKANVPAGAHVVSGGAAWADHLAVALFLHGHAGKLTLHLPAPFENGRFTGPGKSSAQAANYYHDLFSKAIGIDSLAQLAVALERAEPDTTFEPVSFGYGAMFARNLKVAKASKLLAFTFGEGDVPAEGGTKNTWDKCQGQKVHFQLPIEQPVMASKLLQIARPKN